MKIESFNPVFAINGKAHRKEKGYAGTYLIIDANLDVKLDLRIYWTEARCYACVWFNGASGSGYAGGWGYEKTSAAAEAAFRCAGLKISGLSASGMITEALELIAVEILGLDSFKVIHTHP